MKVQFIYPNVVQHPKDISIGIAILSGILKKAGHEVDLIDTTFGLKDSEIMLRVRKFNADLIALSSISPNFHYATHVASLIKDNVKTPVIIGGIHPTVAPEETIAKDCYDMICVGEGESALLELVQSMEKGQIDTSIKSLWFKENGNVIRNEMRHLLQDLDSLPYADLDIFEYPRYLTSHNQVATFLSGRGCPYKCTYCINHTKQRLYKGLGHFVRFRSVDNVIGEIKAVVGKYDVRRVELSDDTFTLKKPRVKEFCEKYKDEVGLPFHINARIGTLSDEICRDLSEAGCRRISIGLEHSPP